MFYIFFSSEDLDSDLGYDLPLVDDIFTQDLLSSLRVPSTGLFTLFEILICLSPE